MKYPTLSRTKCGQLAQQCIDGYDPSIEPEVEWLGAGETVNLGSISQISSAIIAEAEEWTDPDRDRFEGSVSTRLFAALATVPTEVLDDRGFWRYLAIRYFWDFIAWREAKPFAKGNHLKYLDAQVNTESVLTRMYLRAQALGGSKAGELAGAIPNGTDFWRSHVLRVRTGTAAPVARAFTRRQATERLTTDTLRTTARKLNRTWSNIVLHLYTEAEATEIVDGVWPESAPK